LEFQHDYQYISIFKVHVSLGALPPNLLKHRDKFSFKVFLLIYFLFSVVLLIIIIPSAMQCSAL